MDAVVLLRCAGVLFRVMKKVRLLFALLLLPALACDATAGSGEPESVVLVHGLGRRASSMALLSVRLEWAGYDVTTVSYESLSDPFSRQVDAIAAAFQRCCADAPMVHFVGHSLGGLVIRGYLADNPPASLGRVVLLTPPNQGSLFVDWLDEVALAEDVLGPVGSALGTDSTDIPANLPLPDYEMGIIAGTRAIHPIGHPAIPGPDDGIVSVEQTRIADVPVLVLPRSHAFIPNSRHAADAVIRFLRTGTFGGAEGG